MNPSNSSKVYTSLEPSFSSALGVSAPTFKTGDALSLFTSTSFLYSLGIMLSVVAAGVMYARAGVWRMEASERGVKRSNEEIKRTTLGLFGVLSLFAIIYTFNADLLTGNVGLAGLKAGPVAGAGGGITTGTTSGAVGGQVGGGTCTDPKAVVASLTSSGGICGGTRCTALGGCAYAQYLPLIESKSREAGISSSIVIALLCRESKGVATAQKKNESNGTFDCGLLQVNQPSACDAASLDPATNITRGIQLIKQKISNTKQVYQNIPPLTGAFASYNCCANGTIPNAPSVDCTPGTGFPYTIPKWACPINPGDSKTNMCFVKGYACDVQACVNELNGV